MSSCAVSYCRISLMKRLDCRHYFRSEAGNSISSICTRCMESAHRGATKQGVSVRLTTHDTSVLRPPSLHRPLSFPPNWSPPTCTLVSPGALPPAPCPSPCLPRVFTSSSFAGSRDPASCDPNEDNKASTARRTSSIVTKRIRPAALCSQERTGETSSRKSHVCSDSCREQK